MPPTTEEREHALELLNDEFTRRIEQQLASGNAVDTKATFLMGAAALGAQLLLTTDHSDLLAGVALAFFAIAFGAGVWCIRLRVWNTPPDPRTAADYYGENAFAETAFLRERILGNLVVVKKNAIIKNQAFDKEKSRAWNALLVALALGVVCVVTERCGGTRWKPTRAAPTLALPRSL